jgi:hypothetical protein
VIYRLGINNRLAERIRASRPRKMQFSRRAV